MEDNSPIFITGTWRSGSTLISRILNAHQNINIIYDGVHILNFISLDEINKKKIFQIKRKEYSINKITKKRFNVKIELKDKKINKFYISILKQISKNSKKQILGEKSNVQWRKINDFLRVFPNGRVLHIIRDPRAVLASWKNFTYAKNSKYLDSIFNSYDSMKFGLEYKKKYKLRRYSLVKYEDLVLEPKKTLIRIMRKFRIKYDKNMLDTKNFVDNFGKKWNSNSVYRLNHRNKIYKKNINMWKKKLNNNEIFICEKLLNDLMIKYGYIRQYKKNKITDKSLSVIVKKLSNSDFLRSALIDLTIKNQGKQRFPLKTIK